MQGGGGGGRSASGHEDGASFASSHPLLAKRKGPGCVQIKDAFLGRQAWARLPAGCHQSSPLWRERLTLRAAGSSLPAEASVSVSGRWALVQACPPCFCRRVLGSRAQGRTLGVSTPVCSGSAKPVARTTAKAAAGGARRAPRCSFASSATWGLPKPTPSFQGPRQPLSKEESVVN